MAEFDLIVVGGGIVGLGTAREWQRRYPEQSILLLEKEAEIAQHQTGRNSGVIHAGVYYTPGSLKAMFCKQGLQETIAFCQQNDVAYEQCGKLLVATNAVEQERMAALYQRCQDNDIDVELLDQAQLQQREPNIEGLGAIYVRDTGIVDYPGLCAVMARKLEQAGVHIRLGEVVVALEEDKEAVTLTTSHGQYHAQNIIACAGLQADRLVDMTRLPNGECMARDFQIVPFRGEYYQLPDEQRSLVKHLIYPIPDPDLPFLGVHLTPMIDGSITVGPNAVLGWHREGYGRFNLSVKDSLRMLGFGGFWRLLKTYWRSGIGEFVDAWWRVGYLKRIQKYCPQLTLKDLRPYPTGIRAQAVLGDGSLVHDFLFAESARTLHVCNAPSPAATSAMPIARYICDRIASDVPEKEGASVC